MSRVRTHLILLLVITGCKPSGPDPEITQELRMQAKGMFTAMKAHFAATTKWPSFGESGYRPHAGFTVEVITRQPVLETGGGVFAGGFIATVTHIASGQCIRINDENKFSDCPGPLPPMFLQPQPAPPKPTPPPPAGVQSGEMQPLGFGGDLDTAHEKGRCSTSLGIQNETGLGGKGELPKGGFARK